MWYLKSFLLRRSAGEDTIVAGLANHCQQRLARAGRNGPREKKPSWFEVCVLMSISMIRLNTSGWQKLVDTFLS